MDREEEGSLPFLDLHIKLESQEFPSHAVYRNPTSTGRYLNAGSHPHPAQKKGVISTLVRQAITLCNNDAYLKKELAHLKEELVGNGYQMREIDVVIRYLK